jgi:glyoxylase-like metal-dependent hydrolase (beta-lactamase superfamily II)
LTPHFPGLHRIELPLPFELAVINVYLVRLDDGYLLIDCGIDTAECLEALTRALAALSIEWNDIHRILVTHSHPDHIGLARKLLELTGAELLLHRDEANHFAEARVYLDKALVTADVPAGLAAAMDESFADVRQSCRPIDADRLLSGGERITSGLGDLEVIWTRGHSPGHVCLYAAQHRVLFSGDQILPQITPNIGWHPGHDALGEYLASLDRLSALEVDLILPSHGAPFRGHREWIRATIRHHAQRCRQIETALDGGEMTAHALVGKLWTRALSPVHHWFAVFEVLAHLEYLKRRDRLAARREGRIELWSLLCDRQ